MGAEAAKVARQLTLAEERLRAAGLTGAQAFDAMMDALDARAGRLEHAVLPEAKEAVADLPVAWGVDLVGLAYERFFPDLFKGKRGQYFTPPPIARLLVDRLQIQPGERVLDPACGAGGLLARARSHGGVVSGIERDPRLARLARLGLSAPGAPVTVEQADMFRVPPEPVDVVVANPPFSVPVRDPDLLAAHGWHGTALSDQLFVELLARWVRPGGRAGIVMPASLLQNAAFATTRERLSAAFVRTAICVLPEGVFRPFGGAAGRAVLLWLVRRPSTQGFVSWSRLDDPGYDPRSIALKPTSEREVDARLRGEGWRLLEGDAWAPPAEPLSGRPLAEVATLRAERAAPVGSVARLDLGDVDRTTGEPRPVHDTNLSGRQIIHDGDVLVAKLRPERGNATVARHPGGDGPLVGSPEWVVLEVPRAPRYVWLVLRSPAWRSQLPLAAGQTRPRTSTGAVLSASIPWPDHLVDRVDQAAAALLAERDRLRSELAALEAAVHAYVASGDAVALERTLDGLTGGD